MIDNITPCLLLTLNRCITCDEYEHLLEICKKTVYDNYVETHGKYFHEINEKLTHIIDNEYVITFEILAKGEYFNNRMLIYAYCVKENKKTIICLDDHSMGYINLKPVYAMREYLHSIGAVDDESYK